MLKHSYDYQCRCADCVAHELFIRAEFKRDEEERLRKKYSCQTVTLTKDEPFGYG